MIRETQFVFLIPAYNCEKEIKQTLMSIFAQSYDNWRIILIDDVSTPELVDSIGEEDCFKGKWYSEREGLKGNATPM